MLRRIVMWDGKNKLIAPYIAETIDDIKPEHKAAVAMLDAVDMGILVGVKLDGIGEKYLRIERGGVTTFDYYLK